MEKHLEAWQIAEHILGGLAADSSRRSIGTSTSAQSALGWLAVARVACLGRGPICPSS